MTAVSVPQTGILVSVIAILSSVSYHLAAKLSRASQQQIAQSIDNGLMNKIYNKTNIGMSDIVKPSKKKKNTINTANTISATTISTVQNAKNKWQAYLLYPIIHALKTLAFIFLLY